MPCDGDFCHLKCDIAPWLTTFAPIFIGFSCVTCVRPAKDTAHVINPHLLKRCRFLCRFSAAGMTVYRRAEAAGG
jgi:hypothetical protein